MNQWTPKFYRTKQDKHYLPKYVYPTNLCYNKILQKYFIVLETRKKEDNYIFEVN